MRARDTALSRIMDEWASTRDYETRIQNIRGVDNPLFDDRLNEDYFLVPDGDDATVFADDSRDMMFDGWGMDWFFAGEQDRVLGRRRSDVVDRLMMME